MTDTPDNPSEPQTPELPDLDEQEARLRHHLESAVADLIAVFEADATIFMEREFRKRFEANLAFAETLSEDDILAAMDQIESEGSAAGKRVAEELSGDMDFWFGPDVPHSEGKSLEAHSALGERLQSIASATGDLLASLKVPSDGPAGYEITYAPPAYFVNGKYAPGLAESFWKYLAQLGEVREARRQQDVGRRRAVQRHRWDLISQKRKSKG